MSCTQNGRDFSERDVTFDDKFEESSTITDVTQDRAIVIQNSAVFSGFVDVNSPFKKKLRDNGRDNRKTTNEEVELQTETEKTRCRKIRKTKPAKRNQDIRKPTSIVPALFERDCVSAFFDFPLENNQRNHRSSCDSLESIEQERVTEIESIHELNKPTKDIVFRKTSSLKLLVVQNPRSVVEAFEKHLSRIFNCEARLSLHLNKSDRNNVGSLGVLFRPALTYFMKLKNPLEYLIYPTIVQNCEIRNPFCPGCGDKPPEPEVPALQKCNCSQSGATCVCSPTKDKPPPEEKKCSCMKDGKECECYKALQGENAHKELPPEENKPPPKTKKDPKGKAGEKTKGAKSKKNKKKDDGKNKKGKKDKKDKKDKKGKEKKSPTKSETKEEKGGTSVIPKKTCVETCVLPSSAVVENKKAICQIREKAQQTEAAMKRSCSCATEPKPDERQVPPGNLDSGREDSLKQPCRNVMKEIDADALEKLRCKCRSGSETCRSATKIPSEILAADLKDETVTRGASETAPAKPVCSLRKTSYQRESENVSAKLVSQSVTRHQSGDNTLTEAVAEGGKQLQPCGEASLKQPSRSSTKGPTENTLEESICTCRSFDSKSQQNEDTSINKPSVIEQSSGNASVKSGCTCGTRIENKPVQTSSDKASMTKSSFGSAPIKSVVTQAASDPAYGANGTDINKGCICGKPNETQSPNKDQTSVGTRATCESVRVASGMNIGKGCTCEETTETESPEQDETCDEPCLCEPPEEPPPLENCECEPPIGGKKPPDESLTTFNSGDMKKLIDSMKNAKENDFNDIPKMTNLKCIRKSGEIICKSQIVCSNTDDAGRRKVNTIEIRIKYPKCHKEAETKNACACTDTSKEGEEMRPEDCVGFENFVRDLQKQVPFCCRTAVKSDFSMLLDSLVKTSSTAVECCCPDEEENGDVPTSASDKIEDTDVECIYRRAADPTYKSSEKLVNLECEPAEATESCEKTSCKNLLEPVGKTTSHSAEPCSIPRILPDLPKKPCVCGGDSTKTETIKAGKIKVEATDGEVKSAPGASRGASPEAKKPVQKSVQQPVQKPGKEATKEAAKEPGKAPAKKQQANPNQKTKFVPPKKVSSKLSARKHSPTKNVAAKEKKKKCVHRRDTNNSIKLDDQDKSVLSNALNNFFDCKQAWRSHQDD